MRSGIGCGFCHRIVWTDDPTWPYCGDCRHRADRPRMFCDCPACRRGETVSIWPLDVAEALARAPIDLAAMPDWLRAALAEMGVDVEAFLGELNATRLEPTASTDVGDVESKEEGG